ncbi:CPA1 family monovalent cation:H+ antiporter [Caulobacter ginsengisoli]|uniref:CPA1 family monovalent cation:H+ antiporter n=1 Tax=Caulobacter ginsengisoli TaxID=400775 RepID=A0ABU0IKC7_9CAUL|nr:cation:proton antiporter [Caulobacter ginsengisoli]MDQ0462442.1 CPA1 family monovalent cation:H+ antiporter [Caulobacter ginsengisoli]
MTLTPFELAAGLLALAAAASWINAKLLKLPAAAGLLILGLLVAALAQGARLAWPQASDVFATLLDSIDFSKLVLDYMLAFLLFAGALNVDLAALARRGWATAALATLGTAATLILCAAGFWGLTALVGQPIPFAWALVFGALISPTDPIAVLAMTKRTALQPELRAQLEGEALFNDGLAVVLFRLALAVALAQGADAEPPMALIGHGLIEAFGGALLGLAVGAVAVAVIHAVEDWATETLVTIAAAVLTYAVCLNLGLSGPIGVVCAGLIVGSKWAERGMSPASLRYIHPFWHVADEGLNAILFLLVGLEAFRLDLTGPALALLVAAPLLVLAARWLVIALPGLALRLPLKLSNVLAWAGVRGGLSLAMALSLPDGPERAPILAATLGVIVFSILVQSLTMERLALKTGYGLPLDRGEDA